MVILLVAAAVISAITLGSTAPHIAGGSIPRPAAAACGGPVTPVRKTDALSNARRLGNVLWISTVYEPGYPTKTAIEPNWHGHLARVVLRGWRCSDGRSLRFWFRNEDLPFSGHVSQAQLASTGTKRLTVRLAHLRREHFFVTGYFLFSSPGKWVVEAREGGNVRGTTLFDFRS